MSKYIIRGQQKLVGEVPIIGAKNSVLPILAATVINGAENVILNTPRLRDVDIMVKILKKIGCKVERKEGKILINSSKLDNIKIPEELVREMRSSIVLLGAMLSRTGEVTIGYPGGCQIGPRPIDLHLKALKQMGVKIKEDHGFLHCSAETIKGCDIQLDYPSVGATENIMLAAVKAKGTTTIRNAAREPEIVDLENFLNAIGGKVCGAGTSVIRIDGVDGFNSVEHRVIPDRIETGTYMIAAAITGGEVLLKDIEIEHVQPIIAKLREMGCEISLYKDSLNVKGPKKIKAIESVQTLPYPGFPTDMQAQMMSLLSIANGTSVITETVFENRFMHAEELVRMGANIKTVGKVAIIKGVEDLTGAKVSAKDLRGGAALILAGLAANGETEVENILHIERGYDCIEDKLRHIGAKIEKV